MTKIKPKIQRPPSGMLNFIHTHVMYLNNSKFFAGVIMILLNIGSKFITVQFTDNIGMPHLAYMRASYENWLNKV